MSTAPGTPMLAFATIGSLDAARLVAFYRGLLQREVTFDEPPYTVLAATPHPVTVAFQQLEGPAPAAVHIDLYAADVDAASRRVEELGGQLGDWHTGVGSTWRQVFDPDGNVFCLLRRPQQS